MSTNPFGRKLALSNKDKKKAAKQNGHVSQSFSGHQAMTRSQLAAALGRLGGSQPKHYSAKELDRRRARLAKARAKRWPDKQKEFISLVKFTNVTGSTKKGTK